MISATAIIRHHGGNDHKTSPSYFSTGTEAYPEGHPRRLEDRAAFDELRMSLTNLQSTKRVELICTVEDVAQDRYLIAYRFTSDRSYDHHHSSLLRIASGWGRGVWSPHSDTHQFNHWLRTPCEESTGSGPGGTAPRVCTDTGCPVHGARNQEPQQPRCGLCGKKHAIGSPVCDQYLNDVCITADSPDRDSHGFESPGAATCPPEKDFDEMVQDTVMTEREKLQNELREIQGRRQYPYTIPIAVRRREATILKMLSECICRNCGKRYMEPKSRGDYKGFCSAKCQHAKVHELGFRKGKGNKTEFAVLKAAECVGSVFVVN